MTAAVADFESLYAAWQQCRKRKRASPQAQRYHIHLLDNLLTAVQALQSGSYQPARPVCFAVARPKAREIHAATFADRVVHHYLVPKLEALYEPVFIHDVYSNRKGKGTHAAVKRLQGFMCAVRAPLGDDRVCRGKVLVQRNGRHTHAGYFLQLDIRSFFNCIDKRILFALIQKRLGKAVRGGKLDAQTARFLRDLVHRMLQQKGGETAIPVGSKARLARVPPHKRLANAGEGKGLPIGNLTSQFFANVYLNELDQFVKHELKCRYYLRYVDDFVLLHHDPAQLDVWRHEISAFLGAALGLSLRPGYRVQRCSNGADFLGYIVRPHYRLVRKRVVAHLRDKLDRFAKKWLWKRQSGRCSGQCSNQWVLRCPQQLRAPLQATLASYFGHFRHAHCHRLIASLFRQYAWLDLLFIRNGYLLSARWQPESVSSYRSQCRWFRRQYPGACLHVQRGFDTDVFKSAARETGQSAGIRVHRVVIREEGYLKGGLKRRVVQAVEFSMPSIGADCITNLGEMP